MVSRYCWPWCIAAFFSTVEALAGGADADIRSAFLQKLRAESQALQNASFTLKSQVYARSGLQEAQLQPTEEMAEASGIIGAGARPKFNVKFRGGVPRLAGEPGNPTIVIANRREDLSFDGVLQMSILYSEKDVDQPLRGFIDKPISRQQEKWTVSLVQSKLSFVTPFYEGMGLAAYLESLPPEAPPWRIESQDAGGRAVIWFPHQNHVPEGGQDSISYLVTVDLSRNANIVAWERWLDFGTPNPAKLGALSPVELKQIDGVWLPVSYSCFEYAWDDKLNDYVITEETRSTLTWADVNAPIGEDAFRLQFPMGLSVHDSVSRQRYKVGGSPEERAREVESLVKSIENLNARSDSASTPTTIPGKSVNSGHQETSLPQRSNLWLLAVSLSVALILLVASTILLKRRARRHRFDFSRKIMGKSPGGLGR